MYEYIEKPTKRIKPPKPLRRKKPLTPHTIKELQHKKIKKLKRKAAIKPKFDELWLQVRAAYFIINPPDYRGMYPCALCPGEVHIDEATLDHIKPRGTHPKLRYNFQNLTPTHALCNGRKGSMSMKAYERRYGARGCLLGGQI